MIAGREKYSSTEKDINKLKDDNKKLNDMLQMIKDYVSHNEIGEMKMKVGIFDVNIKCQVLCSRNRSN